MIATLLAVVTLAVLGIVISVVGIALTVVPFVLTIDLAERRSFSPTRWGAGALAAAALALLSAYEIHSSHAPTLLMVIPLVLAWVVPGVLSLMDGSQVVLGGRQGAHQH